MFTFNTDNHSVCLIGLQENQGRGGRGQQSAQNSKQFALVGLVTSISWVRETVAMCRGQHHFCRRCYRPVVFLGLIAFHYLLDGLVFFSRARILVSLNLISTNKLTSSDPASFCLPRMCAWVCGARWPHVAGFPSKLKVSFLGQIYIRLICSGRMKSMSFPCEHL